MGISQAHLPKNFMVLPNTINQVVNGKREITADTALQLGQYFGIESEF
jgi:antitoxin HigA-1